jgi:sugar O-acyltransferase (sialic acid O-acetyltransferase NeuD family)
MNGKNQLALHDKLLQLGLQPVTLVHPWAVIASDAEIGERSQIMAGVIVGSKATIGKQCIVNTKASIDRDSVLENGAEISPRVTLCGMARVGSCAWIAAGATVLPLVQIGADATVGAGAVVNKNVPDATTVVGIPANPINR